MDISLLADWTSISWADYGIAGAVICLLGGLVIAQFRTNNSRWKDILGISDRVAKMADENAARLERLSGEYAENIKENTKATAIQTEVTRALNDYLRSLNGSK